VARIVVFKDMYLCTKRPDLAIKNKRTGRPWVNPDGYLWADPYSREVQDYNISSALSAIKSGFDEVQFDYVRFPARGRIEDCSFTHNPKGWEKWKAIENFLGRAREAIAPYKVPLAVDVFGVMAWASERDYDSTGQRLDKMARYVDVMYPMLYPSHFDKGFEGYKNPADEPYYFMHEGCRRVVREVKDSNIKVIPWIQGFKLRATNFNEDYILKQKKALEDVGLKSFLVWNAGNDYSVTWNAFKH
jgi:hypothetical protein